MPHFLVSLWSWALCSRIGGATVLGIDLGNDTVKAAIILKGRTPEVLENVQSSRATPAALTLHKIPSAIGSAATMQEIRHPAEVIHFFHDFGAFECREDELPPIDTDVYPFSLSCEEMDEDSALVTEISKRKSAWVLRVREGELSLIAEEYIAMWFRFIMKMAHDHVSKLNPGDSKATEKQLRDLRAIVAVPDSFSEKERAVVASAARVAQLALVGVYDSTSVAAAYHSTNIDPSLFNVEAQDEQEKSLSQKIADKLGMGDTPDHPSVKKVVVDLGHVHSQACLVEYTRQGMSCKKCPPKTVVHKCTHAEGMGGHHIDLQLMKTVYDRFTNSTPTLGDVSKENQTRAFKLLLAEISKAKKVLSTIASKQIKIDDFVPGHTLMDTVTTGDIDHVLKKLDVKSKLSKLVEECVGGTKNYSIELIGGNGRVPALKTMLQEILPGVELGSQINPDQAPCLGAAHMGALSRDYTKNHRLTIQDETRKMEKEYELRFSLWLDAEAARHELWLETSTTTTTSMNTPIPDYDDKEDENTAEEKVPDEVSDESEVPSNEATEASEATELVVSDEDQSGEVGENEVGENEVEDEEEEGYEGEREREEEEGEGEGEEGDGADVQINENESTFGESEDDINFEEEISSTTTTTTTTGQRPLPKTFRLLSIDDDHISESSDRILELEREDNEHAKQTAMLNEYESEIYRQKSSIRDVQDSLDAEDFEHAMQVIEKEIEWIEAQSSVNSVDLNERRELLDIQLEKIKAIVRDITEEAESARREADELRQRLKTEYNDLKKLVTDALETINKKEYLKYIDYEEIKSFVATLEDFRKRLKNRKDFTLDDSEEMREVVVERMAIMKKTKKEAQELETKMKRERKKMELKAEREAAERKKQEALEAEAENEDDNENKNDEAEDQDEEKNSVDEGEPEELEQEAVEEIDDIVKEGENTGEGEERVDAPDEL